MSAVVPDVGLRCRTLWPSEMRRLQIGALLQRGVSHAVISRELGCHVRTVAMWANRFDAGEEARGRPRSGRPRIIPAAVDQRLIAFYCQRRPLPGCGRWTVRWAQRYLSRHPDILGCVISRSSIHRRLTAHALRPHRNKYFLQISDPHFFEKMEKIIAVYADAPERLFCLDECTGLQALERVAPELPADGDRPAYHEPEYIRHGAVSIFSVLEVATGQVFTDCIPDHTTATLTDSLAKHVAQVGMSTPLHYILDNYASHSTEVFCRRVAALCHVELPKLETVDDRRRWMQSDDKPIVFHFLPTHGSWLNLIEIWFGLLQQKAIRHESFPSADALRDRILDFTRTWNADFAHPFKWTYTGEGLHEKVVARFTQWLSIESDQLTAKFLGKQLRLMANLVENYWSKVDKKTWSTLADMLGDRDVFIRSIDPADPALDLLRADLNNQLRAKLAAA